MPGCCSAYGCRNRSDNKRKPGVSFHRFPQDSLLREQWVKAVCRINWQPFASSVLCSEHFSDEFLNRTFACGRVELRKNAVPTIFSCYQSQTPTAKIPEYPRPLDADIIPVASGEPTTTSFSHDEQCNNDKVMEILGPSSKTVAVKIPELPRPLVPKLTAIAPVKSRTLVSQDVQCNINIAMETLRPLSKEVAVQVSEDSMMKALINSNNHLEWRLNSLKSKLKHKSILIKKIRQQNLHLNLRKASLQALTKELKSKNLIGNECALALEIMSSSSLLKELLILHAKPSNTFSPVIRDFAMNMNFYSPEAYRYLRQSLSSALPHPRTLARWYTSGDASSGFCTEGFNMIKEESTEYKQMPPLCCICGERNGVHALPSGKESSRRLEWIKFAGIEKIITEKKYWFLCNKHFEDRMFRTKERKCLVFSAFPTLYPPVVEGPATKDGKDAGSVEEESDHQNSSQPKDNLSFQTRDLGKSKKNVGLHSKDGLLSTNISPPSKISNFTCNNVVSQLTPTIESVFSLCVEPITVEHIKSPTMINLEPSPIKKNVNMKNDILLTAINNSDISFSDDFHGGEVIVNSNIHNKVSEVSKEHSVKHNNKTPSRKKKRHYDPVLIESILNKMKLKKKGPIRIVTLEKRQDRVVEAYTMNKLVTVYKQQIRKNKKGKKQISGNSETTKNNPEKLKNDQKCTCSVHCHRKPITTQKSPPLVNVCPGVGVKIAGTINPDIMNIDPNPVYEELFNVSTILTNINERSQVQQLCQMLIESIFKLKNLNIERTMAKLEVYISQMQSIGVSDRIAISGRSLECDSFSEGNHLRNESLVINIDSDISGSQGSSNFIRGDSGNCEQTIIPLNKTNSCAEKQMNFYKASSGPLGLFSNMNEDQLRSNNMKVRWSSYHDHCYNKFESNHTFEKPQYLVKLINIKTNQRNMNAKKWFRPLNSSISKNELARHVKSRQKLINKVIHLRNLINKKNRSLKSMREKIKHLDSVLYEERSIKRIKYSKGKKNINDEQVLNESNNTF